MTDWAGKVGVVTGSANGIGFAIAQRFFDEGMNVVLADYDGDALKAATEKLGDPSRVLGVRTDVSLPEDVQELARQAKDRFGAVHVLVNNAGVNAYGYAMWEVPVATWQWVLGVNLYGAIFGIQAFLPDMLAAGEGHIVNTASGAALNGALYRSPYCTSKHGLLGLSESLYYELEEIQSPVRISVLIPGSNLSTIRESNKRWPDRLGENVGLGPRATQYSVPLTAESGAQEPSIAADALWDALQDGRFLINVPKTGLNVLRTRMLEILGINPRMQDQTRVARPPQTS